MPLIYLLSTYCLQWNEIYNIIKMNRSEPYREIGLSLFGNWQCTHQRHLNYMPTSTLSALLIAATGHLLYQSLQSS